MVDEVNLPAGTELFSEGSPGDKAYVIKEGEIEIIKASGGRKVSLAIRKPGDVIGEMSLLEAAPRFASGRARVDSVLLAISHEQLELLLNTSPSAARALLYTITSRLRATELLLRQSEKMAQLGTLTAGIAHELNNPAAAAQRGANQLIDSIQHFQQTHFELSRLDLGEEQWAAIHFQEDQVRDKAQRPLDLDPLTRSDKEYELETWLDEHDIENSWEIAPVLVNIGFDTAHLDEMAVSFSGKELSALVGWLGATFSVYSLLAEIGQGASRISEIVKSLKSYAYLDQAPVQLVDVHEGLDNTMVMLRSKLKEGVSVRREYTPNLPRIQAYASELSQVWTNIIDNSIDAMNGKGEIIIRTRQEGDWVVVEIEDNGPGIPEEILPQIFSPFFTTKPVGKGTGLGLNITYNIIEKHSGEIKVYSQPGKTRFQICLPINFESVQSGSTPMAAITATKDEDLREILEKTKTIAVVGISDRQEQPNYSVPAYLRSVGYQVIPVNPNVDEVLGEKAFDSLEEVDRPIDTVLIFRRSEAVPEIVNQAIKIGSKYVWMQEGIINDAAAVAGQDAGLKVVMDICMRATHKRLLGGR
jgi:signal transduction histidine kinase/predicted CoA-binding protein